MLNSSIYNRIAVIASIAVVLMFNTGCKKLLNIDPPATSINAENVFNTDNTAIQVVTGFYTQLSDDNTSKDLSKLGCIFIPTGLSSDELKLYAMQDATRNRFYSNSLNESDVNWRPYYNAVFNVNAAIEGLNKSRALTPAVKQQLLGESKFMRAFLYFYLVNIYGDVPLVLGTDPEINRLLPRAPKNQVYSQIITDLKEAETFLSDQFLNETLVNTSTERLRPTKWAAKALLARTYVYLGEYANAEAKASEVIANSGEFGVLPVNQVFLMNSKETVWALQNVRADDTNGFNSGEGALFVLPSTGPNASDSPSYPIYLSDYVLNSFEAGDARATNWVNSVKVGTTTYPYAYKYKAGRTQASLTEYSIVFRISEQYLIRAEARIRQGGGKIAEGITDLNYLRSMRRGPVTAEVPNPLPALSTSLSQNACFAAIEHERQTELFTEWGHRWFDLKRTPGFSNPSLTRADELMPAVTQSKGGKWDPNWKLYPIPLGDRLKNPNLANAQNPGY